MPLSSIVRDEREAGILCGWTTGFSVKSSLKTEKGKMAKLKLSKIMGKTMGGEAISEEMIGWLMDSSYILYHKPG